VKYSRVFGHSCLTLGLVALTPSLGVAQGSSGISIDPNPEINYKPHSVTSSGALDRGAGSCNLIDFEGVGDTQVIGAIPGAVTVTFGPSWLGLIDADAGGTGNFANEPSPSTIAIFLNLADPITFSSPVQFVQVFYTATAASVPITLTAWDSVGNVVATTTGSTIGTSVDGAPCGGDPAGDFCLWDIMTLTAPSNSIRGITFSGAVADQFGFDNMTFCTGAPITPYCFGTNCPCGNDDPNAGCRNSTGQGALMSAAGSPSVGADDLTLTVSNVPANKSGLLFMAPVQNELPLGDGKLCGTGGFTRFGVQNSGATGVLGEGPGIAAAKGINPGETWNFQGWFRDPAGPCGNGSNTTNAASVTFSL